MQRGVITTVSRHTVRTGRRPARDRDPAPGPGSGASTVARHADGRRQIDRAEPVLEGQSSGVGYDSKASSMRSRSVSRMRSRFVRSSSTGTNEASNPAASGVSSPSTAARSTAYVMR